MRGCGCALSLGQHTGVYKHEDKVRPRRYGVFLVYVKRRISKRRFGEQREHAQTMTRHSRELVGCAPHTALSITGRTGTTEYFVKPGAPDATSAVALCEREAALFANLPGSHRIEDGAMCICNPVRETLGGSPCVCCLLTLVVPLTIGTHRVLARSICLTAA